MMTLKKVPRWLPITQGIYFFITGAWALLHIESFIWISGPKYDIWLVKTVGIILALTGIVMFSAGYHKRINTETFLLAAGSAAALTTVDIYYVSIGRIWSIYLLDAGVEIFFLLLWLIKVERER